MYCVYSKGSRVLIRGLAFLLAIFLLLPMISIDVYAATNINSATINIEDVTYPDTVPYIQIEFDDEEGYRELYEGYDYTVECSNNEGVGTATVTITGIGEFVGSVTKNYEIESLNINDCYIYDETDGNYEEGTTYTGSPIKRKVGVYTFYDLYDEYVLTEGVDYRVEYKNNVNAGTATYSVVGIGNCTGIATKDTFGNALKFKIYRADIEDAKITGLKNYTYRPDGNYPQSPVVTYKGKTLKEGEDYIVEVDQNIDLDNYYHESYAEGWVYITGKGNFEGVVEKYFNVNFVDVSPAKISLKSGAKIPYSDMLDYCLPEYINVTLNGKKLNVSDCESCALEERTDCYIDRVSITGSKITFKICGSGLYCGETDSVSFPITRGLEPICYFEKEIGEDEDGYSKLTYTGYAIKPDEQYVYGVLPKSSVLLSSKKDYTVSYKNNTNVGIASLIVTGKGDYTGQRQIIYYRIIPANISKASIAGIQSTYKYTGKEIKPAPVVKLNLAGSTKTLIAGTDYTVSYKNNTREGTATVTIKGKGNFAGTASMTFKIVKGSLATVRRLKGDNRFGTATAVANAYRKDTKQTNTLKHAVVANAFSAADALSAGPLANQYKAPILLIDQAHEKSVLNWIKKNVKKGGEVFLIGGNLVVRDQFRDAVAKAGYKCTRVAGNDRLETNLAVLRKLKLKATDELLVTEGSFKTVNKIKNGSFHEALLASATGKPLLLVGAGGLTANQQKFLKNKKFASFMIIGNTTSTTKAVESALLKINKKTDRLTAKTIDALSVVVAKHYWPRGPQKVFVATSNNFADALAGGPLCGYHDGPIFLVNDGNYTATSKYLKGIILTNVTVFGGNLAVSDALVKNIANVK